MQVKRILLVEDDREMRQVVLDMLGMLGYAVQAASTAEEALRYLEREEFAVLMADVVLPGMSGIDLAHEVHIRAPNTRIIFTTGAGYLISPTLPFQFTLVAKPFYLVHILEALKDVPASRKTQSEQHLQSH